VDPEYNPRSMQVIDDLVEEQIEQRDVLLIHRNDRYWAAEEESGVDPGLILEIRKLTNMFHVCLAVIRVLVSIIILA